MIVRARRVLRPGRRRGAHPRARVRPVHRHGPGAGRRRRLRAHLQPQLPRPERHARATVCTCARRRPAAATALRGEIADPRELGEPPVFEAPPGDPELDDRQIVHPPADGREIELVKGRNIVPPPAPAPVPESIAGRVLIVVPDDVSTGDMAPDGVLGLAIWSNIPACARYMFRRFDPEFPARAEEWGGGIVVGGPQLRSGLLSRAGGVRGAPPRRPCRRRAELRPDPPHEPDRAGDPAARPRRRPAGSSRETSGGSTVWPKRCARASARWPPSRRTARCGSGWS